MRTSDAKVEMDLSTLQYKVDSVTGAVMLPQKSAFNGIIDHIRKGGKEYIYMTSSFGIKEFNRLIRQMNPLHCFDDLFEFIHFAPMPDFETASLLDKRIYFIARESDIRTMKRLRAYVDMENEFYLNN